MQNLIVTTTDGTKTVSKNYSFINPAAADSDCVAAITALNSLSDNSLVGIDRVARSSLDLPSADLADPELSLSSYTAKFNWAKTGSSFYTNPVDVQITVTRSGTGTITASSNNTAVIATVNGTTVTIALDGRGEEIDATVTVNVAATDSYSASSATIAVSAGEYQESGGGGPVVPPVV